MKLRILATAALLSGALSIHAAQAGEMYLQGGTQGLGVGYAQSLNSWLGVHADLNGGSLSHGFDAGSMHYDGRLHLFSGGLYLDAFPIASSAFRVTGGVLVSNTHVNGTATSNDGNFVINGQTVSSPGSSATVKIRYPAAMPYLGIGFGHKPTATKGFNFTADLGVAYGRPRVSYNASPELVAAAGAENVNAEMQSIQDKANKYRFYPIVQLGLTYRF